MPGTWESPFAADSLWYVEIDRINAELIPAGITGAIANFRWDEIILINTPASPERQVWTNAVGWDCGAGSRADEDAFDGFDVPIPDAFVVVDECPDTPNRVAAIVLVDGQTLVNFQPFNRETASGRATYLDGARHADDDFVSGDGRLGAHGGSGLSGLAGTIRTSEFIGLGPGDDLGHCLKLELNAEEWYDPNVGNEGGQGYRWPADRADSCAPGCYGGAVGGVHNGALLTLPDDFDFDTVSTLPAKIIARTLLLYGGRIVDSTSWDAMAICAEYSPDSRFLDDFTTEYGFDAESDAGFLADMQTVFSALMLVDNDGPFNVGGAGEGGDDDVPSATEWSLGGNVLPIGDEPIDGSEVQFGQPHKWVNINPLSYTGRILQYVYTDAREHRLHFLWDQDTVDTFQVIADSHASTGVSSELIAPRGHLVSGVQVIMTQYMPVWNQNVRGLVWYDVWMTLVERNS